MTVIHRYKQKPGQWSASLEDRLLRDGVDIFNPEGEAVLYAPPDDTMEIEGGRIVECLSRERKLAVADIVRKLNSFDDLLEAAAEASDWLENHGGSGAGSNDESGLRIVCQKLTAAIAKAKGK